MKKEEECACHNRHIGYIKNACSQTTDAYVHEVDHDVMRGSRSINPVAKAAGNHECQCPKYTKGEQNFHEEIGERRK
jgi:hypothetical protein